MKKSNKKKNESVGRKEKEIAVLVVGVSGLIGATESAWSVTANVTEIVAIVVIEIVNEIGNEKRIEKRIEKRTGKRIETRKETGNGKGRETGIVIGELKLNTY